MSSAFARIAFTDAVKRLQERAGSRAAYGRHEAAHPESGTVLGPDEAAFIEARDSFYLATVSETGWPYVQHRGGDVGFVRVIDPRTIRFTDVRGNRQFVSLGNLAGNDRVAMIFMDYPARARLKLLGHARVLDGGVIEVHVEAVDWNCSQHITPRFTVAEIEHVLASQT